MPGWHSFNEVADFKSLHVAENVFHKLFDLAFDRSLFLVKVAVARNTRALQEYWIIVNVELKYAIELTGGRLTVNFSYI